MNYLKEYEKNNTFKIWFHKVANHFLNFKKKCIKITIILKISHTIFYISLSKWNEIVTILMNILIDFRLEKWKNFENFKITDLKNLKTKLLSQMKKLFFKINMKS